MSLKKGIASTLAVAAILVTGLFVAPAAYATGNPGSLDQGDFSIACKNQYGQNGWIAQLYGNTAYDWKCVYLGNPSTKRDVDINRYCMTYWGVWAASPVPSNPYSWRCQGY